MNSFTVMSVAQNQDRRLRRHTVECLIFADKKRQVDRAHFLLSRDPEREKWRPGDAHRDVLWRIAPTSEPVVDYCRNAEGSRLQHHVGRM